MAALEAELGLDRPLPVRYGEWLAGFFTGNLGVSLSYRQEVGQLLGGKAAVTLLLSGISFALIVAASIPGGGRAFFAVRQLVNRDAEIIGYPV